MTHTYRYVIETPEQFRARYDGHAVKQTIVDDDIMKKIRWKAEAVVFIHQMPRACQVSDEWVKANARGKVKVIERWRVILFQKTEDAILYTMSHPLD